MGVELVANGGATEVIVLVTELGVAVFNAAQDVFGQLGFHTGASSPTNAELAFVVAIAAQLNLRTSDTTGDVWHDRVQVVAETCAQRAFEALLDFQTVLGLLGPGVTSVTFNTVYELVLLEVPASISASLPVVRLYGADDVVLGLVPAVAELQTGITASPGVLGSHFDRSRNRRLFLNGVSCKGSRRERQQRSRGDYERLKSAHSILLTQITFDTVPYRAGSMLGVRSCPCRADGEEVSSVIAARNARFCEENPTRKWQKCDVAFSQRQAFVTI